MTASGSPPRRRGLSRFTTVRVRVFSAALVIGLLPIAAMAVWFVLVDLTNQPLVPDSNYPASEVLSAWSGSGTEAPDPLTAAMASQRSLRSELSRSEYETLVSHTVQLGATASGSLEYAITDANVIADTGPAQGLQLPKSMRADLRARGYAWGVTTYSIPHYPAVADGQPAPVPDYWTEYDSATVVWMSPKGEVRYIRTTPQTNGEQSIEFPYWWIATVALIATAVVTVLALLVTLLATRGVAPRLKAIPVTAETALGTGEVASAPEGGPADIDRAVVAVNRLAGRARRAQRAEQSFLLSVSHELKTPLTSIKGYAEGLRDKAIEPETAGEVIGSEAGRLERLVQDVLDLARYGRGEFAVRHETVDLADVARDVAERYRPVAESIGVRLEVENGRHSPALGDHDRIVQVVSNLVENALRCTTAGEKVVVRAAPGEVSVADGGPGLGADDLERVFERFYLYDRYGRDRQVGTGLGLSIVKDLTEKMGGSVSVASEVGVGSTFTVRLPREGVPAA